MNETLIFTERTKFFVEIIFQFFLCQSAYPVLRSPLLHSYAFVFVTDDIRLQLKEMNGAICIDKSISIVKSGAVYEENGTATSTADQTKSMFVPK